MGKYKKVLAAVDGSDAGRNAFRQACRIAKDSGGRLKAVTAIPVFADQFETLGMREKALKVLEAEGEKILSVMAEIAAEEGVAFEASVGQGSPAEVIIDAARQWGCDLVVMGRRGMSRLDRVLMGSVTARVVGHTGTDVLVVPRAAKVSWRVALVPSDGSKYGDAAARRAMELSKAFGSEIAAISVVDVNEEFQASAPEAVEELVRRSRSVVEAIRKEAEAAGIPVRTAVREDDDYVAITEYAKECRADVIVMGTHGRTGLGRAIMGSVTGKVIGHTDRPVLVVHA